MSSSPILLRLGLVALVLYARPGMSQGAQTRRDTVIDVEDELRTLYGAVLQYHDEQKVWPSTLYEACGGSGPRCPMLSDEKNSEPLDSWGLPVYYKQQPGGFEIRSFGPDRRPGTSDDFVISYPNDLVQAKRIAGCYRPVAGWWSRTPADMRLDTLVWGGGYGVTGAFPRQVVSAEWFPTTADSIAVEWTYSVEVFILRMRIAGDTLKGRAAFDDLNWNGIVRIVRVTCGS